MKRNIATHVKAKDVVASANPPACAFAVVIINAERAAKRSTQNLRRNLVAVAHQRGSHVEEYAATTDA